MKACFVFDSFFLLRSLCYAVVCMFSLGDIAAEAQLSQPNILIITADNLGYGDLRCYNSESPIVTPRLDQFAQESARLTSFYTASSTCTVSRACLLTGRIPERHGLVNQLPGLQGNYGVGLNQKEILIPSILKTAPVPYATGCFGKWNIGFAEGSRPTERGFDQFLGHASGNIDYYHHIYSGKHDLFKGTEELHVDGKYAPDLFADAAIDFIKKKSAASQPWFCYLPCNSPHFPSKKNKLPGQKVEWQAPDRAFKPYDFGPKESDPTKRYYAVVTALDEAIGRVLDSLKQAGVEENTFVFFYSDNGTFLLNRKGIDIASNDPLRSGGITCWEGGIRVVAMVRWPGKIKAGITLDEPLWSPDLLIAATKLADATLPKNVIYDGKNPLPVFTDNEKSPHESFYFNFRKHSSLRLGDWKIVREKPDTTWQLFNLKKDISEKINLASQMPEVVDRLQIERQRWEESF